MLKIEIRKLYKAKRQQLTVAEKAKMDDLMLIQFQQLPLDIPTIIMTYAPSEKLSEFDPQLIIDYCYFKNIDVKLVYPVILPDIARCEMRAVQVNEDSFFDTNQYGIIEPVDGITIPADAIELCIIPLLGFDNTGNRVGYGKGYYDRFLSKCSNQCVRIGFSYFGAVDSIEDVSPYDIRLDYCITPERIFTF